MSVKRKIRKWGRRAALWMGICLFGCLYAPHAREAEVTFSCAVKRTKENTEVMRQGVESEGSAAGESTAAADLNSESPAKKVAYLTFDDGPSTHSDELLDILKEENVKATFFLGLHSYSHVYKQIYSSVDNFREDLWKLKTYLYHITGVSCDIYRFPGGSSTTQMKFPLKEGEKYLEEKGIRYFDWNATAEDAVCVQSAPGVLMARVLKDALKHDRAVILMHDLNCCKTTLNAVRPLIARLRKEDYAFDRLTKDSRLEE